MKKIVYKYQVSKYRRFTNGLLFASITLAALVLCLIDIFDHSIDKADIILPFCIAIISMTLGFISMFGDNGVPER